MWSNPFASCMCGPLFCAKRRLESNRFDSIRFDSIRFDSIRFDSIQYDCNVHWLAVQRAPNRTVVSMATCTQWVSFRVNENSQWVNEQKKRPTRSLSQWGFSLSQWEKEKEEVHGAHWSSMRNRHSVRERYSLLMRGVFRTRFAVLTNSPQRNLIQFNSI